MAPWGAARAPPRPASGPTPSRSRPCRRQRPHHHHHHTRYEHLGRTPVDAVPSSTMQPCPRGSAAACLAAPREVIITLRALTGRGHLRPGLSPSSSKLLLAVPKICPSRKGVSTGYAYRADDAYRPRGFATNAPLISAPRFSIFSRRRLHRQLWPHHHSHHHHRYEHVWALSQIFATRKVSTCPHSAYPPP